MNLQEQACTACERRLVPGEVVLTVQPQVVTKNGRAVHAAPALVCVDCTKTLGLTDALTVLGVSLEKD